MNVYSIGILLCFYFCSSCTAWDEGKIKLKNIEVLTLHDGRMTTGRRNSPIPQLKCVGGTAGCSAHKPKVVQCYNKGSDGHDVQWECKAEMIKTYRFGTIDVICEGYDYPDDPYVLKGSCGLEYSLELTNDAHNTNYDSYSDKPKNYLTTKSSSGAGDIIILIVVCIIIYAIYKTCLTNAQVNSGDDSSGSGGNSGRRYGSGYGGGYGGAPPPGFRPDYMPNDSCGSQPGSTGGGFWTGAATGGILGYMFGSRNSRTGYSTPSHSDYHAFGGTGPSSSSGDYRSSSETRTTSGFGGTRRR